jgi:hypothetical protein
MTPRTVCVIRQCAPPSRVNQSGDSEGPEVAVLADTGRPVGAPAAVDGLSRSYANPSSASANWIVSMTAVLEDEPGALVDVGEDGADEDADGAEVDVVDPVGVVELVEVVDPDPDDADDAPDVEEPLVGAGSELVVTAAGGEGMATNRPPPSEVRTISVQGRCPHGTVPSSQNSLGEISA